MLFRKSSEKGRIGIIKHISTGLFVRMLYHIWHLHYKHLSELPKGHYHILQVIQLSNNKFLHPSVRMQAMFHPLMCQPHYVESHDFLATVMSADMVNRNDRETYDFKLPHSSIRPVICDGPLVKPLFEQLPEESEDMVVLYGYFKWSLLVGHPLPLLSSIVVLDSVIMHTHY